MRLPLLTKSTVLVLSIATVAPGSALAVASHESPRSREFSESWVLVRLRDSLPEVSLNGSTIRTGAPALDTILDEEGIQRIDSAIPTSLREPRSIAALMRYGLDRTYRLHVTGGKDVRAIVDRLSELPQVVYAELDHVLQLAATVPDDPLFPQQWALNQISDADVDAPEAWDISVGEPVIVAVIDTGIDETHIEFRGVEKLAEGWNFDGNTPDTQDYNAHGTAMASIVAANTDNTAVMAGACWDCRIMPLKATLYSAAADALVWAADRGARVVNISQSGSAPSETFLAALAYAYDAGVIVVTSAGNTDTTPIRYPARYAETIAVGATTSTDERARPFCFNSNPGSCYGSRLDVVAPGDRIVNADSSTAPGGQPDDWYHGCGTSQATALVSGMAGVVRSFHPSVGRRETRNLIRAGAEDQVGNPAEDEAGFDPYYGWGRVNMDRTLRGAVSAMSLRVEGAEATRPYLDVASPLAESYDFIRGDLASVRETRLGVELGGVVCLEDDSPDPDTVGNEDGVAPQPGEAFFYLARANTRVGVGSYGGSSRNRDRRALLPPAWARDGGQPGGELGFEAAGAGDVNNDGYDDVILGARSASDDQSAEGSALVHLGSADGLQAAPAWTAWGNQSGSWFGRSVESAGDVNGDGYDDVVVGASYHSNGHTQEGRAYVFEGSASGPAAAPDWIAEGDQAFARFGERVAPAGDLNGDGYDDLLVTAPQFDAGQTDEGRAFVYFGSANGLGDVPWTFESDQAGARLGFGGGSAGDVNGDGYDDLVLGAHRYDAPEVDEGRLYLFLGSPSGPLSPPTTLEIDVAQARLGRAAATAGDINGDGYDDIIAGAVFYTGAETQEGAVFVYEGSSSGISTSPSWSFTSGQGDARLGTSAATAGDVNGDGYADVVVGADTYDSERSDEGGAWVFLGSSGGLADVPHWVGLGGQTSAGFGVSVAGAGNVDSDQSPTGHPYDEVIVGAFGYDDEHLDEGRVYLYRGSASGLLTTNGCSE